MQDTQIAGKLIQVCRYPVTIYKNKSARSDLKELMERAVSASWGKWFQTETELGTKDDWKALVCAQGWCIKGKE